MKPYKDRRCVRYEMTQLQFRRTLGQFWSPRFIKKFGDLSTRLYKQLYKKDPPSTPLNLKLGDRDPVNLYPYGILQQAYGQLIEAGEPLRGPGRTSLASKSKKPENPEYPAEKARSFSERKRKSRSKQSKKYPALAQSLASLAAAAKLNGHKGVPQEEVRKSFSRGRSKEGVMKYLAKRLADAEADKLPKRSDTDDDDNDY